MFESRLEEIVLNNRTTIALLFPTIGALMMIASAELSAVPSILRFNPVLILIGVVVMRMPLISGIMPLFKKRAVILMSLLVVYTYVIEIVGVKTGYPYGEFEYGVSLGPMLFDIVPIALPLFFIPLVLNSYLLSVLLLGDKSKRFYYRVPTVISFVILIDLVLDPASVSIGLWEYSNTFYYGVPVTNYFGWILSATVATLAIDYSFDIDELTDRVNNCEYFLDDMVSFIIMWGSINLYYLSIIPVLISALFVLSLVKINRFDFVGLD